MRYIVQLPQYPYSLTQFSFCVNCYVGKERLIPILKDLFARSIDFHFVDKKDHYEQERLDSLRKMQNAEISMEEYDKELKRIELEGKEYFKNEKVLPKDITIEVFDSIVSSFSIEKEKKDDNVNDLVKAELYSCYFEDLGISIFSSDEWLDKKFNLNL